MPFDTSMYENVGRVNLAGGLSEILNQQRQREAQREDRANRLADLAQSREMQGFQTRALQRAEAQIPKIEAQKKAQDLNMWLANEQRMGRPLEDLLPEAIAKGAELGVDPEATKRHVTGAYGAGATPQSRASAAAGAAYPELQAKAQIEGAFPKPTTPIAWQHIETDKGIVQINPQTGEIRNLGIKSQPKATADGGQRGQIIFDQQGNAYNVNPYTNKVQPVQVGGRQIQGAQYAPGLQGQLSGARSFGSETGKATGEASSNLQDIQSQMPHLDKLVTELSNLGKKATYTKAGQIVDIAKRQFGMESGEGAIARKEYISKVDNEILPLLRQTFGAAFTQKEGEALRVTLGDPDASPEEKDAVLRSFIQTKKSQVESLKRRTGETGSPESVQGAAKFLGFE